MIHLVASGRGAHEWNWKLNNNDDGNVTFIAEQSASNWALSWLLAGASSARDGNWFGVCLPAQSRVGSVRVVFAASS